MAVLWYLTFMYYIAEYKSGKMLMFVKEMNEREHLGSDSWGKRHVSYFFHF